MGTRNIPLGHPFGTLNDALGKKLPLILANHVFEASKGRSDAGLTILVRSRPLRVVEYLGTFESRVSNLQGRIGVRDHSTILAGVTQAVAGRLREMELTGRRRMLSSLGTDKAAAADSGTSTCFLCHQR